MEPMDVKGYSATERGGVPLHRVIRWLSREGPGRPSLGDEHTLSKEVIVSIKDPVESRRQSLEEIAASWDLEGALPDAETLEIARQYADGAYEIEEAIERIRTSTLSRCASQQA